MKRLLIVAILAGLSVALPAQKTIDILSLSGRYGLPGKYQDSDIGGKATEWGSVNSFTAGVKLGKKMTWGINLNHFYFNVQGQPDQAFDDTIANPLKVNGIILRTGLLFHFSEGRTLQVLAAPRIMSDFKNLDGNSFMMGGALSYKKQFRDELSLGFGAMYNKELFGHYLVPFLDIYWEFAGKWRAVGLFPITLRVEYLANDNLTLGLNHFGLITTYYLGDDAVKGSDGTGAYLERQSIDLSLFARHRIAGNIFVEGMAGYAVGRNYKQYRADQTVDFGIPLIMFGDDRVPEEHVTKFNDGLILTLKLVYNMPIPE